MVTIKERKPVTIREIMTIWLCILILYRLRDHLFPGGIPIASGESLEVYMVVHELSVLLWLVVQTLFSFLAKRFLINSARILYICISFSLVSVVSSILIFWGSLYIRIWFGIVFNELSFVRDQSYFLLYTITPLLFYLHYRIVIAPFLGIIKNKDSNPLLSVKSIVKNIKICGIGIILWGYALVLNAALLSHQITDREVIRTYSINFGSYWFLSYCLICLYFRYMLFQRRAERLSRMIFTFVVVYLLASLFTPLSSLSIQNICQIDHAELFQKHYNLGVSVSIFVILAFYFNVLIQKIK